MLRLSKETILLLNPSPWGTIHTWIWRTHYADHLLAYAEDLSAPGKFYFLFRMWDDSMYVSHAYPPFDWILRFIPDRVSK